MRWFTMREEYNFVNAKKSPYAEMLKKQVTINLSTEAIDYFKEMAGATGIPYQTLINLYLTDCAAKKRKLSFSWSA